MDSLSAFMVLVISFAGGGLFALFIDLYARIRGQRRGGDGLCYEYIHRIDGCPAGDGQRFWFIVLFEMMSLSSRFLVIAGQDKTSINAGMLYFFIAHAGSVLITDRLLADGGAKAAASILPVSARFHFLRGWRRRCSCWPSSVLARKPG